MLRGALRGICPAEALGIPRMQNRPVVGPDRPGKGIISAGPAPPNGLRALLRTQYRRRGPGRPAGGNKGRPAALRPLSGHFFHRPGPRISTQGPLAPPGRTKAARRRGQKGGLRQQKQGQRGQKSRPSRRETIPSGTGNQARQSRPGIRTAIQTGRIQKNRHASPEGGQTIENILLPEPGDLGFNYQTWRSTQVIDDN